MRRPHTPSSAAAGLQIVTWGQRVSLVALAAICLAGCSMPLNLSGKNPFAKLNPFHDEEEVRRNNVRAALHGDGEHSRLIGDYIRVADSTLGFIKVQGIGLVDRLDGTGEDPPDSPYRKILLNELRRHEIEDPATYLAQPTTALVIVTAFIPPIVRKGDKIDVQVQLPDGSEATSLASGYLMPCRLTTHALLGGQVREGRDLALSRGLIMVDSLADAQEGTAGQRRGVIPGGATYIGDDRDLTIGIRNEYRTVRMSSQLATRIGRRFHDYDEHGIQTPMAKALNHTVLQLKVHEKYRENYPRYLQVIRNITLTEQPVERHLRMQQLGEEIKLGPMAEQAALQLEAIGSEAVPVLKTGLGSGSLEARFRAAEALAYLGHADGVPALEEAVAKEPAFRVFALAALATLQDGRAAESLRTLMAHDSVETRYGAFRALSTLAPNDHFIRGLDMEGAFTLHPVAVDGEPLIHVTRHKKAEVVVFGDEQRFQMPLYLRAGSYIMAQGTPQGDRVVLKRIAPGEKVQTREVSSRVVDVIVAASELGAGYPEVVQMLVHAEQQRNLPGRIAIDEMPKAGRVYERPAEDLAQAKAAMNTVQVGSSGLVPNIFDSEEEKLEVEYEEPAAKEENTEAMDASTDFFLN
ncbi:MAG: flagellar basal body P-ring protein FlgI [Planctomycetaceae bacterium]|nr:flagellar basal body P-ring protein FlgI [Planctomycetaceae bacterium]